MHCNFGRPHPTLNKGRKVTPDMAAGVAECPWSLTQIAGLLD